MSSTSSSSFSATFIAALNGTTSVLLTIFSGYLASYFRLVNRPVVKQLSNIASVLFLPCLIIVQTGPQLTEEELRRLWIIPVWGLVSSGLGHLIGYAGQVMFGLKAWTIIAAGRSESNALPVLLLQSLEAVGVFESLKRPDETIRVTMTRAQSMILLNSAVQQTLTFALGPPLLRLDGVQSQDVVEQTPWLLPVPTPRNTALRTVQGENQVDGRRTHAKRFHYLSELCVSVKAVVHKVSRYLNPPLIGTAIALVLGLVPPLRHTFLDQDGPLYVPFTQVLDNLGNLLLSQVTHSKRGSDRTWDSAYCSVVVQMFTLGAQLEFLPSTHSGFGATLFILFVRFALMPGVALGFVYCTARKGWYNSDPLLWFVLVLIPSGPSAMLLISLAEMMDVDQEPVSRFLTISYALSPLMAVVCSLALRVVDVLQEKP